MLQRQGRFGRRLGCRRERLKKDRENRKEDFSKATEKANEEEKRREERKRKGRTFDSVLVIKDLSSPVGLDEEHSWERK